MAKRISVAEHYVVTYNTMRTKDGPPVLWEWLANILREDGPDLAHERMSRHGLPPRPSTHEHQAWRMLDRVLRLIADPSLDVNEPVNSPAVAGLSGPFSMTPLHWAASGVHRQMFAWLMARGANPQVLNDDGDTVGDILSQRLQWVSKVAQASRARNPSSATRVDQTLIALRGDLVRAEQAELRGALQESLESVKDQESRPSSVPLRPRARL